MRDIAFAAVPFLIFVLCLGVVVDAVMMNGLDDLMRGALPVGDTLLALLGIATVAAVLSNLVDNLPAVLVLLPLVTASGPSAVLAVPIGVNLGPNLTYVGSLANPLWRAVARRDMTVRALGVQSDRLCTVPFTLLASVLALWLAINLFGV